MSKRTFSVALKKEVINWCLTEGNSPYEAVRFFGRRDGIQYSESLFYQWFKNREKILTSEGGRKRVRGGGRKTVLGELEEILFQEIVDLRIAKVKVTREFVSDRAHELAEDHGLSLKACDSWVSKFMARHELSLRRMTNLTTLTDDQLIQHYLKYLRGLMPTLNRANTLLMDETAIYFEDARMHTVDIKGRHHVVIKSTGFASMRITAVISVWANGRKAVPLIIHKGKENNQIIRHPGPILAATQPKAWVNAELIIRWIDTMFPVIDVSPGKCIIWDSCRAHIAARVKHHCHNRNIQLVVIPGGMTPYLQAGDIGIYRELKDHISKIIDAWKKSPQVEYTKGNNPKPPRDEVVRSWLVDSWRQVSLTNIENSIKSAGFADNYNDWHIAKHDVYGENFRTSWQNAGDVEVNLEVLEQLDQEDELFEDLQVLNLDESSDDE